MTRSSQDIEREVEATRSELDRTVEALKDKMTPGQLLDEVTRSFNGTGASDAASDMMSNLGTQVRDNPLPLALIGAGVAWLMMGQGTRARSADYPTSFSSAEGTAYGGGSSSHSGLADKAAGAAESVKAGASHLAEKVSGARDGMASAASHMRDGGRSMGAGMANAADKARHQAADYGHRAQRTFMDTLEQEPLIIGALGLAVGAAIGAALPPTRMEDRAMGATRDKVLQKGKAQAQQGLADVKQAAATAVETVRQEAASAEGDGSLVERAERAVRAGVDAAKGDLEQRPH